MAGFRFASPEGGQEIVTVPASRPAAGLVEPEQARLGVRLQTSYVFKNKRQDRRSCLDSFLIRAYARQV